MWKLPGWSKEGHKEMDWNNVLEEEDENLLQNISEDEGNKNLIDRKERSCKGWRKQRERSRRKGWIEAPEKKDINKVLEEDKKPIEKKTLRKSHKRRKYKKYQRMVIATATAAKEDGVTIKKNSKE